MFRIDELKVLSCKKFEKQLEQHWISDTFPDLSDYLRKALVCIDSTENEPVPTPVVKTMIAATSVLITKLQNTPDMSAVMETLASIQNDLKMTADIAHSTAARIQENRITHQQIATLSRKPINL
ncbi:hypothetical protein ACMFMG_012113 [Clarireedia jacksonii]